MRTFFRCLTGCFLFSIPLCAQTVWPLWPGTPPNAIANNTVRERSWRERDNILRVNAVAIPTLTAYLPDPARNTGTAVMICPGGAYGFLALEIEGTQVAEWLAGQGIAAFVLKYRLPDDRLMTGKAQVPLLDALQGLRLIRQQAASLKIKSAKIGIMGFSAGGHLAASASTHYHRLKNHRPAEVKPDFAVLVYPVILEGEAGHAGSMHNLLGDNPSDSLRNEFSNDRQVTAQAPPTVLFHPTPDATVPVENSIAYYTALKRAGVSAEMHLYHDGGHGFGMSPPNPPAAAYGHWKDDLLRWLDSKGLR